MLRKRKLLVYMKKPHKACWTRPEPQKGLKWPQKSKKIESQQTKNPTKWKLSVYMSRLQKTFRTQPHLQK